MCIWYEGKVQLYAVINSTSNLNLIETHWRIFQRTVDRQIVEISLKS